MSKIILLVTAFFLATIAFGQSIYTYSVTSIEGENKPLSAYSNKKLLIITLPTQQNASNDSLLHSLDSLRAIYSDSVVIIGAPSYEDGYTTAKRNDLKLWYRSILGSAIVVTDGVYTRKTSGSQQHPLFKWLTDKTKNEHFDQDITGTRNKFFVWKDGELVGVLGAQTRLSGAVMHELLQGQ